jgi:hypothetical protein
LKNVFGEDRFVHARIVIFAEVLEALFGHIRVFKHCGHSVNIIL